MSYNSKAINGGFWEPNAPARAVKRPKRPVERYDVETTPNRLLGRRQRVRRKLWKRNPHCIFCGKYFEHPDDATIEHLFPRKFGGTDSPRNLAISCEPCNQERDNFFRAHLGHHLWHAQSHTS